MPDQKQTAGLSAAAPVAADLGAPLVDESGGGRVFRIGGRLADRGPIRVVIEFDDGKYIEAEVTARSDSGALQIALTSGCEMLADLVKGEHSWVLLATPVAGAGVADELKGR